MKRKIRYELLESVIMSAFGPEFVLHIPKEYDYRFSSSDKRNEIVRAII